MCGECNEGNCSVCRWRTAFCACNISEERKEDESVGSSVDLYEEVEEVLTAEEEEREDTWSERDITAGQRTGEKESSGDDVDSNQEGMESFKDGNGRNLREQITEEEDGGTTKSGGKSEGGDRKKNQGTKLHEEESFKEKEKGREEQTVVLETPLINLKEEMDTSEGSFKLLKRKMKGDEESIATKNLGFFLMCCLFLTFVVCAICDITSRLHR